MAEPSTKKQKTSSKAQSNVSAGPRITDPRFANIQSDPRYRLPGKKNKVKLDKRFARVLEDDDFVKRAKVDRYGRPLESKAEKNRLKRKYEFDEDEDEEEGSDSPDNDDEVQKELSRVEKTRDPLRDGRDTDSESSDEASTSDEEFEEDDADDVDEELNVGPTQQQDVPTGEVTSRIALVNLDWDNIHAADLMAVFSSFLPSAGGSLLHVAIYPSEFGKERLEREEMEGPPKEIFSNAAREHSDDEDIFDQDEADEEIKASILKNENGDEDFNPTSLRKYQLERLRYFYAILTFSSPSVAKHIYDAVDGTEYLRTANFFDLRFVPDDTDFSLDVPRENCERIPDDYKPNEFVTDALQHSKVKLTWDAEDTGRKEAVARAFQGGKAKGRKGMQEMMDENDLRAYLASDGSDDEEEEIEEVAPVATTGDDTPAPHLSKKEAERQRMRALLGLPLDPVKSSKKKDKAPVGDMQITFTSGLNPSKDDKKRSVFENSPELEETTLERYVRKERERKLKRKNKTKSGAAPDPENQEDVSADHADENLQENHDDNDDLGFDDPFFASNESSTLPENPSNKLRKEERLKKRQEREAQEEADRKQRAELELLMADDPGNVDAEDGSQNPTRKMKHFDMREIERAEKEERKKGKKGRAKDKSKSKAKSTQEPVQAGDEFEVNTSDPRFSQLFESHEFAIDPTNPRFKGTKGMKALLDEGRKRKSKDSKTGDMPTEQKDRSSKGKKSTRDSAPEGTGDVKSLVEKIKRRQKA